VKEIDINDIVPNAFNPNFIPPEELEEMRRNFSIEILKLNPIKVREAGHVGYRDLPEGKYEIIDGYYRWLVAKEKGLEKIPVEIHNCDDQEAERMCITSSLHRGTHSYLLLSVIFEKYHREGFTQEEIGRRFGYTQPMVAKILNIYSRVLPPLLKKANYKDILIFIDEYSNIFEKYSTLRKLAEETSKKMNNYILVELATIGNDSLRDKVLDWLLTSDESVAVKGKRIPKIAAKCNEVERYAKAGVKTEEELAKVMNSIKDDIIDAPEGTLKSRIDLLLEREQSRAASFLEGLLLSESRGEKVRDVVFEEKEEKEKEKEREKEGGIVSSCEEGRETAEEDSASEMPHGTHEDLARPSPAPKLLCIDEDKGDERLAEVLEEVVGGKARGAIIRGDCFRVLDVMASKGIKTDLIVTDPPYNISGKGKCIKKGDTLVEFDAGEWDSRDFLEYIRFLEDFLKKADRVLRRGGTIYMMLDYSTAGFLWRVTEFGGLRSFCDALSRYWQGKDFKTSKSTGITFKEIRIWKKKNPVPSFSERKDVRDTEFVLVGIKDNDNQDYVYNRDDKFLGSIDECPIATGKERELYPHPTAKPVELFEMWVKRSSNVGDVVLDPFAGRGTAAVACLRTKRRFIIIEKEREHFATARRFVSNSAVEV